MSTPWKRSSNGVWCWDAQQNLGAAIRAAYFLGAAGVLCCARNSAPLSPVVSKASAGALERLPIHACHSMPRTLSRARELGWAVIGVHPCTLSAATWQGAAFPLLHFADRRCLDLETCRCTVTLGRSLGVRAWCRMPQERPARRVRHGLHACAGAGNEEAAVSCRGFVPSQPTILVVGNEGRGLRTAVQRACTTILRVDSAVAAGEGRRAPLGVDSLNVSVATGILLHQLLQVAGAAG